MTVKNSFPIFLAYLLLTTSCESLPEIEIPADIASMEHLDVFSIEEAPKGSVSFERVTAFGDTEEFYFGQLGSITVDDSDRVYLADGREGLIHVYHSDGSYIRSLGRKGGGPGEFQSITSMQSDHSLLYVMDIIQRRLTAFHLDDLSLAFTLNPGSEQDEITGNPVDFAILSNGNLLVFHRSIVPENDTVWQQDNASIFDRDGQVLKANIFNFEPSKRTFLQTDQGFVNMTFPFTNRSVTFAGLDDLLYYGFNDRMFIQVFNMDGSYHRAIYYDHPNAPFNHQHYLDQFRNNEIIHEALQRLEMPALMPAFSRFFVDDENRIWVNIINDDQSTTEWWILNDDGSRLAVFHTDARNIYQFVKNGYVYVIEYDEKGAREMVKYRIGFRYEA